MGNRHPSIAPYETLATRDGSLAVAIGNDRQFAVMATALGRPALAEAPAFATNHARVLHRTELVTTLEDLLGARTTDEWTAEFRARGLTCGKVNDIAQAIGFATELGLDPVVTLPSTEDDVPASRPSRTRCACTTRPSATTGRRPPSARTRRRYAAGCPIRPGCGCRTDHRCGERNSSRLPTGSKT